MWWPVDALLSKQLHKRFGGSGSPSDHDIVELERRARELTSRMFALSEKRVMAHKGMPTPEFLSLAASALLLQKAIAAFLAVEKLCE